MKTKLLALAVACATASFAANAAVSDTWSAGASAGYVMVGITTRTFLLRRKATA